MTGADLAGAVLLSAGTLVTLVCGAAVLRVRDTADRLHLLAPITVLAGPLVGAAVGIRLGWSTATAAVALIVVLLAVTGAVLQAAVGRLVAEGADHERAAAARAGGTDAAGSGR
jgi:uncharacterized membrane protein